MASIYNIEQLAISNIEQSELNTQQKDLFIAYAMYWNCLENDSVESLTAATEVLKAIEAGNDRLVQACIILFKLRIAFVHTDYSMLLSNISHLRKYMVNGRVHSDVDQLIRACYNYFAAHGREKNILLKGVLFRWPPSSKADGISKLKELSLSESVFISTEANYFLGRIFLECESDHEKASIYFSKLNNQYPKNSIFQDFYQQAMIVVGADK